MSLLCGRMRCAACTLLVAVILVSASPVQASQCTFYTVRSTVYLLVTGQAKLLRNGVFVQWVSTGKYTIGPVRRGVSWKCG